VAAGAAACNAIELDNTSAWQGHHLWADRSPGGGRTPAPTTPWGYEPAELQAAYGLTAASASDGRGKTVAIVDAYNDPYALSNLSTYRSEWGLSPVCTVAGQSGCVTFTVENQGGTTRLPSANAGWSEEISVDLDMVSAICPNCNILLVEATSPTFANLGAAELTAAAAKPVSIGNSYGGGEPSAETSFDSYYDASTEAGIAITASSGDSSYGVEYPAASPDVVAVGGTTLTAASGTARGWTETAWSGAGSGCSAYEAQQSWQKIPNITTSCANRGVADVAAVADPNTGVAVYDSYGLRGWTVFGGTSVAAQIISAVYALAGGLPSGATGASELYAPAAAAGLFDVTSGSNGSCGSDLCTAGAGWDGPTGLGTPNGTGAF
jgi:subtilase family serine protease